MSAAAYEAFQRVLHRRKNGKGVVVDGYKGLFTGDQPDLPEVPEALEVRAGDGHGAPSFQNSAGGKRKKT